MKFSALVAATGRRRKTAQGWIDGLSGQGIRGWAALEDDLSETLTVEAFHNGRSVGRSVADEFRADLAEKGYGHGRHGFCILFDIFALTSLEEMHVIAKSKKRGREAKIDFTPEIQAREAEYTLDNVPTRPRLQTVEELDLAIEAADEPGVDRGKRISDIYFLPDLGMLDTLDPFSAEYKAEVVRIYQLVRGSNYEVAAESNISDFDIREPGPYDSHHPHLIGQHLGGIATVVSNMELLPPGRILDIGAGWGNTSLLLARCGFQVDAIDINDRFIEVMKHWAEREHVSDRLTPMKLEFDQIKTLSSKYAGVLFFESFHHCLNHLDLLKSLEPMLADDGVIVFAGEPIYSHWGIPWGLRHDEGLATYCIRKFGWLELGFSDSYFLELLERVGFYAQRRLYTDYPVANGFLARKVRGGVPLGSLAIRRPYEEGWNLPDQAGRFTKGNAGLPMALFREFASAVVRFWNYGPAMIVSIYGDDVELHSSEVASGSYNEVAIATVASANTLWIRCPSWCPADLGMSADPRKLGIYVVSVSPT